MIWLEVVAKVHEGFEIRDLDLVWEGRGEGERRVEGRCATRDKEIQARQTRERVETDHELERFMRTRGREGVAGAVCRA